MRRALTHHRFRLRGGDFQALPGTLDRVQNVLPADTVPAHQQLDDRVVKKVVERGFWPRATPSGLHSIYLPPQPRAPGCLGAVAGDDVFA